MVSSPEEVEVFGLSMTADDNGYAHSAELPSCPF
jgi:hypothetical protein